MKRPTDSLKNLKDGGVSLANDYDLKRAMDWISDLEANISALRTIILRANLEAQGARTKAQTPPGRQVAPIGTPDRLALEPEAVEVPPESPPGA